MISVAPSILAADFARLGAEVRAVEAAGIDRLHLDVMDGHFVPNISFGMPIVAALRAVTTMTLDVHLMIARPERHLRAFAEAGAQRLSLHVEAVAEAAAALRAVRALGCRAGLALNPETPASALSDEALAEADELLVMTVQPGFGGQDFRADMLTKLRALRARVGERLPLVVDGGIDARTAPLCVAAGARVLVAGSAVFRHPSGEPARAIREIRAALAETPTG